MNKFDTYQEVTNAIVAALEAGAKPWSRGWKSGGSLIAPRRANGEFYRGINVLLLWAAAAERGYTADRWLTFKQAAELGGGVRKGEKGTRIVFFKALDITREGANGEDETRRVPMIRTYTVFNAQQVDGLPEGWANVAELPAPGIDRDHLAEAALRSCGAAIRETGDKAYYSPAHDFVNMPTFGLFATTGDYITTLAHELCHWTGHKSRLDRALLNKFGSKDYAFEELVAEIGAAFVGARLGIIGDHLDNHVAYLASWLTALKGDKRAIFRAASLAQAAADMVLANAGDPIHDDEGEAVAAPAPAEPTREAQLVQLRAASPLRPAPGRTAGEDGLALFDHGRQLELL